MNELTIKFGYYYSVHSFCGEWLSHIGVSFIPGYVHNQWLYVYVKETQKGLYE